MSEESVDARPLTSVELLDAAVWREIGSEEAQPASVFLDALSRLVGRWLLVRSDAPEMDAVTVLCKLGATSRARRLNGGGKPKARFSAPGRPRDRRHPVRCFAYCRCRRPPD